MGIGSIIMGGLSVAGGLVSSVLSSIESRRAANELKLKEGILTNSRNEQENLFNKQFYQDITQRTDVQNILRMLNENQSKQKAADDATAAVSGASTDQQLAAMDSRNSNMTNAMSQVASQASQLKDQYLNNWQNTLSNYWQQRLGLQNEIADIHRNTSNQWSTAGDNFYKTGANLMGAGLDKQFG